MKKEDIIKEIADYVNWDNYGGWYVGITNDAERRLFDSSEHNVDKNKGCWIHCPADSKQEAQEIEEHFLKLGMDGDTGGGKDNSTIVYCYMKTTSTKP